MIVYKVFYKNYEAKARDLIGVLIERRSDLRNMTLVESGLRWARFVFGNTVGDRQAVFVVPDELDLSEPREKLKKYIYIQSELGKGRVGNGRAFGAGD